MRIVVAIHKQKEILPNNEDWFRKIWLSKLVLRYSRIVLSVQFLSSPWFLRPHDHNINVGVHIANSCTLLPAILQHYITYAPHGCHLLRTTAPTFTCKYSHWRNNEVANCYWYTIVSLAAFAGIGTFSGSFSFFNLVVISTPSILFPSTPGLSSPCFSNCLAICNDM